MDCYRGDGAGRKVFLDGFVEGDPFGLGNGNPDFLALVLSLVGLRLGLLVFSFCGHLSFLILLVLSVRHRRLRCGHWARARGLVSSSKGRFEGAGRSFFRQCRYFPAFSREVTWNENGLLGCQMITEYPKVVMFEGRLVIWCLVTW